ncbi:hypothetical protein HN873_065000, partial [Arachis hypogaea]
FRAKKLFLKEATLLNRSIIHQSSGSEKSIVVSLIERFYDRSSGLVSQEPTLFATTFRS